MSLAKGLESPTSSRIPTKRTRLHLLPESKGEANTHPQPDSGDDRQSDSGKGTTNKTLSSPADALLLIYSDTLDDVEQIRMATENRVRALKNDKFLEGSIEAAKLNGLATELDSIEKQNIKELEKLMKNHPLGKWVKGQVGLGLKQSARLLAVIGDPLSYIDKDGNEVQRTVSKLWAYCGMGVVDGEAPKSRKGVPLNWNPKARSRIRLIAESCIKHRHSPYRKVYDEGREKYEAAEITDLHKHNRALRLVAKEILKDIYREAKKHE